MPGETPSPSKTRSPSPAARRPPRRGAFGRVRDVSAFIEAGGDQGRQRVGGALGLPPGGADLDLAARRCGQHHQPHDGHAGHGTFLLRDRHGGVECRRKLYKPRRCTGVQPFLIDDGGGALDRSGGGRAVGRLRCGRVRGHFTSPARSWEATLMYLRPASRAEATASASFSVLRTLASLISIGRFMPAMTSIFARSIIEIARFEGVPPNMSVSTTTPAPSSTRAT